MRASMNNKNYSYQKILFISTAVSFVLIISVMAVFVLYAPGHYNIESSNRTWIDIVFALALLINNVCILLSMIEFIRTAVKLIKTKEVTLKSVNVMLLGIYPALLMFCCCNWRLTVLSNYVMAPFRIILNL